MKDDAVFKALADRTRRKILDRLRDGPRTTGELNDLFSGLSRYGVMKHLGILERAGLLLVRREGRFRWNYLNPVPIQKIHERWIIAYVGKRASSLLKLKEAVEGQVRSARRKQ
jgi:DNA-binding transcriptional ArsR family regulator